MAVTLESLHALLNGSDLQIFSDGASTLLYRVAHRGQILNVEVGIAEEGGYVRLIIPCYLNLYDAGDRSAIMLKLLELNRFYKLLKFSCDPADGEICVSVELPICDGVLTQEQVSRCMFLMTNVVLQERDRLMTFQQTGIYPSSDDPNFAESVERILEGSDPEDGDEEVSDDDSMQDLVSDDAAARE